VFPALRLPETPALAVAGRAYSGLLLFHTHQAKEHASMNLSNYHEEHEGHEVLSSFFFMNFMFFMVLYLSLMRWDTVLIGIKV